MALPVKTIKVGTSSYRVTQDPFDTPERGELDEFDGSCWHPQRLLYVEKGMNEDHEKEITLHELMHIAVAHGGSQHALRDAAQLDGSDPEELYVAAISSGLFDILRLNPKLAAWILAR